MKRLTICTWLEHKISIIPSKDHLILMGNYNASFGNTTNENVPNVGKYGLGDRNSRGERLLQFAIDNDMVITNTIFKHHPRRLSTWISPGKSVKNQIDYILVRSRWVSSFENVKVRPGALCGSDHKLLWGRFRIRLRRVRKTPAKKVLQIGNTSEYFKHLNE